jgi:hypothetical protein
MAAKLVAIFTTVAIVFGGTQAIRSRVIPASCLNQIEQNA